MFKMAKKKGSGKKQKLIFTDKDDQQQQTNSDSNEPCCHLSKAIRLQSIKNVLPHCKTGHCKDCRGIPKVENVEGQNETEILRSVCICLKCGYQGCSRQCNKQHAHNHFLQQSSHTVCVNSTTWMVWCYACDKELNIDKENSSLQKAVKHIREKLAKESKTEACGSATSFGKVKGLRNLGNTCFFNSVLQNISQTTLLMDKLDNVFTENQSHVVQTKLQWPKVEMKLKISTPPGPLTTALKCFLDEFRSSSRGIVVPSKLFGEITKKSPQFRGYRQQDSQELLRYLLDGMRVEEMKRIESAMKEAVKNMETPPSKEELRECFRNSKTFVDDLFGGSLVSTIVCTECRTKSQVYDEFLDLSLPVNNIQVNSANESAKTAARKPTLKSQAASKTTCDAKGDDNADGGKEQTLSKHQKKVMARKDKKAKRRRRSSSCAKASSEGTENHGDNETIEDEANDSSDEEQDGCKENDTSKDDKETEKKIEPESCVDGIPVGQAKPDDSDEMTKMMANIVIKDHKDFVLIEKKCCTESVVSDMESRSEEEDASPVSSIGSSEGRENEFDDGKTCDKSCSVELEDQMLEGEKTSNQQILGGNVDSCVDDDKIEAVVIGKEAEGVAAVQDSIEESPSDCKAGIEKSGEVNVLSPEKKTTIGQADEQNLLQRIKEDEEIGRKIMEIIPLMNKNCVKDDLEITEGNSLESEVKIESEGTDVDVKETEIGRDEISEDNSAETEKDETKETVEHIEWIETIGEEYKCKTGECSIMSCLNQFSNKDWLTGNNKFKCEECTRRRDESSLESETQTKDKKSVFTVATKQMLLWKPASILTLHLKRFEHVGRALRKVNKFIEFPLNLDMSPFFHKNDKLSKDDLQYSLCGIVEHSGSLHGGHYVAYVKSRTVDNKTKWYHVSDSRVSEVQEEAVLKKQAYLLFYQRKKN